MNRLHRLLAGSFVVGFLSATFVSSAAAKAIGGGGGPPPTLPYSSGPDISGGTFNGTPPQPVNFANGFSVSGDFSFTAGGGPATITYKVEDFIKIGPGGLPSGTYRLFSGIDGTFSTTALSHAVLLTEFSSDGFVAGIPASDVALGSPPHGGLPVLLPASGGTPLAESAFGNSGRFFVGPQTIDLEMTVKVSFSGLQAGDVVHVDFPNGTTFGTPEPASLTLLGLGSVGIAGFGLSRRKPAVA